MTASTTTQRILTLLIGGSTGTTTARMCPRASRTRPPASGTPGPPTTGGKTQSTSTP